MSIEYIDGDVRKQNFDSDYRLIPHCCNDVGAMGAGVAAALASMWPKVRQEYIKISPNYKLGHVQAVRCSDNTVVFNMIGQHETCIGYENGVAVGRDGKPPIRYDAINDCMDKIATFIKRLKSSGKSCELHCPKFGSDLAGGDWNIIEKMIIDKWSKISRVLICVY